MMEIDHSLIEFERVSKMLPHVCRQPRRGKCYNATLAASTRHCFAETEGCLTAAAR